MSENDVKSEQIIEMTEEEFKELCDKFSKIVFDNFEQIQNNNNNMQEFFAKNNRSWENINTNLSSELLRGYFPTVGQEFLTQFSSESLKPSQSDLSLWLQNPQDYQEKLRKASRYFEDVITQYKRTIWHFTSILTFRNILTPITRTKNKKEEKKNLEMWHKCTDYLAKFKLKYHFPMMTKKTIAEGGSFWYYNESDDFIGFLELPSDYCYLTSKWDWGFTFAIDLDFFDRFAGSEYYDPELRRAYKKFIKLRDKGYSGKKLAHYQYYPVPVHKGLFLTVDPVFPQVVPLFQGVFKDALEIDEYKNLLKQKTVLDSWKFLVQEIPRNKDGNLSIDVKTAMALTQVIGAALPSNVTAFSTPMTTKEVNFDKSPNKDNIVGLGEQSYWRTAGTGSLMDVYGNSAQVTRYGLINDGGLVDFLYRQFENFVDLRLMVLMKDNGSKYQFRLKLFGNKYTDAEDLDREMKAVQMVNGMVSKMYAYMGYEPYEVVPMLKIENQLGLKDLAKPIIAGAQMSGKNTNEGGAPEKSAEKIGDAGSNTRDAGSNAEKT